MSIYPVPLQKWFPNGDDHYEVCRMIVDGSRCENCGKHCKYNRAWGHHSLPWGHGNVWCSEKCLYGPKRRKKKHRVKKLRGRNKRIWQKYFSDTVSKIENAVSEDLKTNALKNQS